MTRCAPDGWDVSTARRRIEVEPGWDLLLVVIHVESGWWFSVCWEEATTDGYILHPGAESTAGAESMWAAAVAANEAAGVLIERRLAPPCAVH